MPGTFFSITNKSRLDLTYEELKHEKHLFIAFHSQGLDLTYEELKQTYPAKIGDAFASLDLTYEELKLAVWIEEAAEFDSGLDLTYEELKLSHLIPSQIPSNV